MNKRSTDISLPERKLSDTDAPPPTVVEQKPKPSVTSPVYVLQLDEQLEDIQEISDDEYEEQDPAVEVKPDSIEYRTISSSN